MPDLIAIRKKLEEVKTARDSAGAAIQQAVSRAAKSGANAASAKSAASSAQTGSATRNAAKPGTSIFASGTTKPSDSSRSTERAVIKNSRLPATPFKTDRIPVQLPSLAQVYGAPFRDDIPAYMPSSMARGQVDPANVTRGHYAEWLSNISDEKAFEEYRQQVIKQLKPRTSYQANYNFDVDREKVEQLEYQLRFEQDPEERKRLQREIDTTLTIGGMYSPEAYDYTSSYYRQQADRAEKTAQRRTEQAAKAMAAADEDRKSSDYSSVQDVAAGEQRLLEGLEEARQSGDPTVISAYERALEQYRADPGRYAGLELNENEKRAYLLSGLADEAETAQKMAWAGEQQAKANRYYLNLDKKYGFSTARSQDDFAKLSNAPAGGATYAKLVGNNILIHQPFEEDYHWDYMTDDEKATLYYLYNTQGEDAAKAYMLDYLGPGIDEIYAQDQATRIYDETQSASGWDKAAYSMASVFANAVAAPASFVGNAGQVLGNAVSDSYNPESWKPVNSYGDFSMAARNARTSRQAVADSLSPVGSFLYQTGMSMADNLVLMPTGQVGTLALMGLNAADAQYAQDIDSGVDPEKAIISGAIAGGIEILTETASIEHLFNAPDTETFLRGLAKQALFEGTEEGASDVLNLIREQALYGKTSYGNTPEEHKQWFRELLLDMAGGALSGGVMYSGFGGARYALQRGERKTAAEAYAKQTNTVSAPMDGTTEATRAKAQSRAEAMQISDEGASVGGEQVKVNGITQVAGENGEAKVRVTMPDGSAREVNMSEVTFARESAELYSYAADMESREVANAFRMLYTKDQDMARVATGMNAAYDMGRAGYRNIETVRKSVLTSALTDQQLTKAYELGVDARATEQKRIVTAAAFRARDAMGKAWRGGQVTYDNVNVEALSAEQQRNVELAAVIAGLAGKNVELFESQADERGRYTSENGSYNPKTNTIRLDVNAGRNNRRDSMAQTALIKTMSHELTHDMQKNAPKEYARVRDAVLDVLESQENVDLNDLVDAKLAINSRLNREAALDEVVADACEGMLRDSNFSQRMQQAHPEAAKTLGQRLRELLGRIIDAIKAAYQGARLSREASMLMREAERYREIADMWAEGTQKAAEVTGREQEQGSITEAAESESEAVESVAEAAETAGEGAEAVPGQRLVGEFDEPARPTEAHIDNRTWESVAEKNVEPFENDYRIARSYMGMAAKTLLQDANESVPGKRFMNAEGEWSGQKRMTTPVLAELMDKSGWTWDRLKSGLTKISDAFDAGDLENKLPNNVLIKRLELVLDEMLTDGYTTLDGTRINPDTGYLAYKAALPGAAKQTTPEAAAGGVDFGEYVLYQAREMGETQPTHKDIEILRDIGRKSINQFTNAEVRKSEVWARKFYNELGVKSPFFRRWFGDWRQHSTEEIQVVPITEIDVSTAMTNMERGSFENDDTDWKIYAGSIGREDTYSKARGAKTSAKMLSEIRSIIKNAVLLDSEVSLRDKRKKNPDTEFMHKLYAAVTYGGNPYIAKVTVEEYGLGEMAGRRFYNLKAIEMSPAAGSLTSEEANATIKAHAGDKISVANLFEIVKRSDKGFKPVGVTGEMLNADGSPKIMYHGSPATFTVFDKKKARSGLYGRGFYFTDSPSNAALYGSQYQTYLKIDNPLVPGKQTVTKRQVKKLLEVLAENEDDYSIENYGTYDVDEIIELAYHKDMFEALQDISATAVGDLVETVKLFNSTNGTNYDGIILPTETVVFEPTQIKNATDNIGTFDSENADIRYQPRDEQISVREMLANVIEDASTSADEMAWLKGYRKDLKELDRKLDAIGQNKQIIRELMFKKGRTSEESQRLSKARERLKILNEQVARMDEGLLKLEGSDFIRGLVEREARKIRDREAEKRRAGIAKVRETQRNAAVRKNIRQRAKRLDRMLREPTDRDHIPEGLKSAMLDLMDIFTRNDDSAFGATAKDRERLYRAQSEYMAMQSADPESDIASRYDEDTADRLRQLGNLMNDGKLTEFGAAELAEVSKVLEHFEHLIRDQNDEFRESKRRKTEEYAREIWQQTGTMKGRKENAFTAHALVKAIKHMGQANITPVYFYKHLGGAMGKLGNDLLKAEGRYGVNAGRAEARIKQIKEAHDYKRWAAKKGDILRLETESGDVLELTREQALGIWASAKRERTNTIQRAEHLRTGGVILEKAARKAGLKGQELNLTPTRISDNDIARIDGWLTDQQKKYADAMVNYISTDMAELGNETSMELVGYRKFGEGYYYPYKTSSDFRRTNLGNVEQALIKNMGFTKSVVRNAKTPVVITDFSQTVADHVNAMLMYNAFAAPQDQLLRVYDFRLDDSTSVKNMLRSAYGDEVPGYIEQQMRDLYGGVSPDRDAGLVNALISGHKRQAVLGSASVVIQQPTAIIRAMSEVSPKYFAGKLPGGGFEEAKQYAGTAVIKDMGGFDTSMSRGATDWINGNPSDWRNHPVRTGQDKISDFFALGAEKADQLAWSLLWKAVKKEQAEKTGLDINSEELKQRAGKRFDEVVRLTQVYDSVMSKSQLMRNKNVFWKGATAFMAEPTLTMNMMLDMVFEARKGSKKKAGGIFVSVLVSVIFTNLAKALVTASRDDDDEEATWLERYVKNATEGLIGDLVPFNYVPIARDVYSRLQGYNVERTDMSIINDILAAGETILNPDAAPYRRAKSGVQVLSLMTGIPAHNLWREAEAAINTATATPPSKAREGWLENALRTGLVEATPIGKWFDLNDSKTRSADKLYEALMEGDAESAGEWRSHLMLYNGAEDDAAVNSLLRSRIKEGYENGELDSGKAVDMLTEHAGMKRYDAEKRVAEWSYAVDTGTNYSDLKDEYLNGNLTDEEAIAARVEYGGADEANAADTIAKWRYEKENGIAYADMKDAYIAGDLTEAQAIADMAEYGGVREADARQTVSEWNYEKESGGEWGQMKADYIAGRMTADEVVSAQVKYGGALEKDVRAQLLKWDYERDTGIAYTDMKAAYLEGGISREAAVGARVKYGGLDAVAAEQEVSKWDFEADYGYSYDDMRDYYELGNISYDEAVAARVKYGGAQEDEAYFAVAGWEYEQETGGEWNGKFTKIHDAVDSGSSADMRSSIQEVYDHSAYEDGKKAASAVTSNITSTYKPIYLAATPAQRAAMEPRLLEAYRLAYELAGEEYYGDSYKLKQIRKWAED